MRAAVLLALAVAPLLGVAGAPAQTAEVQARVDALLALRRAGALVVFRNGALEVSLSGLKGADKLLGHVKALPELEALGLAATDVGDTGLTSVKGLVNLR